VNTVAFLAAMKIETRPFLRRIGRYRRGSIGRFTCYRFSIHAQPCVLVETGVGRSRAADAVEALLHVETPGLVVSFGIAGAPLAGLRVGDVVFGLSVCELDGGIPGPLRPLAQMPSKAWQAVELATQFSGARVLHGVMVTTRAEQIIDWTRSEHPVLEMETSAIAEVCAKAGIPLVALRSVSDSRDDPIPFDLAHFVDDQYQVMTRRFLAAVLRRPSFLTALLRLRGNAVRAAEAAAAAVVAAVAAIAPTPS
jgi:adenosylhomocysteine nucleosidase